MSAPQNIVSSEVLIAFSSEVALGQSNHIDDKNETNKVVELGLTPGRYVLTVGRLVPEKRQLDLLRAFRGAGLNGWKLAIVGQIDHKNKYADLLASEAALAEDVVMAGFQSGDSLRQLYAHAGLFVLPSSHEGLPIALLEALSYGLPVLVSDIPSNLEVVGEPSTNRRQLAQADPRRRPAGCSDSVPMCESAPSETRPPLAGASGHASSRARRKPAGGDRVLARAAPAGRWNCWRTYWFTLTAHEHESVSREMVRRRLAENDPIRV
jgi:hypothetical protein